MKFISKIWRFVYGDLHHFPVPVFEISKLQHFKMLHFQILRKQISGFRHSHYSKFQKSISKNRYTDLPNNSEFQTLRYEESVKDVPLIFLESLKYFGDKYRVRGSIFNRLVGSSRNHQKSIAICLGVKISNFWIICPEKTNILKAKKTTTSPSFCCRSLNPIWNKDYGYLCLF